MTWSDVRVAVNSPRNSVVAIVASLTALGGAVAGGVAALIAATVLTPTEPVGAAQVAMMAVEYGVGAGVAGAVLGTIVAFGALRRVPLGRLIVSTNVGLAAGLTAGWIGGPWAWHHMGLLGSVGFSVGALVALLLSRGSAVAGSGLRFGAVPASGVITEQSPEAVRTLASSVQPVVPTDQNVDHVRRSVPSEQ